MEKAFSGPRVIADRLGVDVLAPDVVAAVPAERFAQVMAGPPAVHRYHSSMGARVQALAAHVCDVYGGDVESVWRGVDDARTVLQRLVAMPGFGQQKAKIFLALLAKQRGVRPRGWVEVSAPYGEDGAYRSIADVVGAESLARVRETKRSLKAAAKATEPVS